MNRPLRETVALGIAGAAVVAFLTVFGLALAGAVNHGALVGGVTLFGGLALATVAYQLLDLLGR